MMAWGQYIHWSNIQYKNYKDNLRDDDEYAIYFGTQSHWMASLYVVIEGWNELGHSDSIIDRVLHAYSDYILILKRCRNAVYHFQKTQLEKRILEACRQTEMLCWMEALREEFERYLFMYPFKLYGSSNESIDLHSEYFKCIGWKPDGNTWVEWFNTYREFLAYREFHQAKEVHTQELKQINEGLERLKEMTPHPCLSMLQRLQNQPDVATP